MLITPKITRNNKYSKMKINNNLSRVIAIIGITLITAFIFQSIVEVKVYLPGLYWLPQTISYQFEDQLESIGGIFNMKLLVFYLTGWTINLPLIYFAYLKINKRYAIWTWLSLTAYTLWGFVFSLNAVINYSLVKNLQFFVDQTGPHITKKVEFYLIAIIAGVLYGAVTSVLWKKDISGGGIDIIYTYFAFKKRKSLQKIVMPVGLIIVTINIIFNELISTDGERKIEYVFFFLINSSLFIFLYSIILDYFYPKFRIVTLFVVSEHLEKIEKNLLKNFSRTATIIKGSGFWQKKATNVILITVTFIEKNIVIQLLNEIDKKAFVAVMPTVETHGNFEIKF